MILKKQIPKSWNYAVSMARWIKPCRMPMAGAVYSPPAALGLIILILMVMSPCHQSYKSTLTAGIYFF